MRTVTGTDIGLMEVIHTGIGSGLNVISGCAQLNDLKEEWAALVTASSISTPFHTPEWLLTWWKHFGSGELRVLAFRNGDDLIAIIPCFLHHWQGRRQLTLLGSGISDYLEPVISAESMPNVLELLSNYLRGTADWDVVDWQDLSAPTRLTELTPVEFSIRVSDDTPCSEILIAGGWDDFYRERPHGLRRNLRRYADKARQLAEIHFFFEAAFRPGLLENLIRLHAARWNRQGEAGTIASNRSAAFLREIVPKLGAHGRLLFFGLDFQGRTVALILSFPYKGILFSYLSAFDPEYEQYGFGKILLEKSLEYAFQERFKSWNFLRGKEPYKFEWGSKLIPKCRLILSRVPQS